MNIYYTFLNFALPDETIDHCSAFRFKKLIPITFLTGFYVGEVVKRYWDQFMSLPVPDRLALKLVTFVPGKVSGYKLNLRLLVTHV